MAFVVFFVGGSLLIFRKAAADSDAVFSSEKAGSVGPIENHPPAEDANEDSGNSFNNENPSPTWLPANAVHGSNCCGEEATEGAS